MRKIILLHFIFFSSFAVLKGQSTSIFIDKLCHKTTKENAIYKRVAEEGRGNYIIKDYYLSGQLYMHAVCFPSEDISDIIYNGLCIYYHPNGRKKLEGEFSDNYPIKTWKYFSADGKDTITARYDINSMLLSSNSTIKFNKNELIKPKTDSTIENNDEYLPNIEIDAKFPGDDNAFAKYLKKIKYPKEAINRRISGKINVYFEIDKEGNICNVKSNSFIGFGLEEEAIRIIKEMPKWTPATLNGRPGKVKRVLPLVFTLPYTN